MKVVVEAVVVRVSVLFTLRYYIIARLGPCLPCIPKQAYTSTIILNDAADGLENSSRITFASTSGGKATTPFDWASISAYIVWFEKVPGLIVT